MANRDLTNFRQVINQVVEQPDQSLSVLADVGEDIIRQGQEAKIAEGLSNAQLELNELQTQYQIDFEGDPLGGMDEYKERRKEIFARHGEGISPFYRRHWEDNVRQISTRNDALQQGWVLKQTRTNTVQSINTSIKNNLLQAETDGRNFGADDAAEIEAFVNYGTGREALIDFAERNLGASTAAAMFESYDDDYMKIFMSGVINENPVKALQMMENDAVKEHLGASARGIKKAAEQRVLNFKKQRQEQAILNVMAGDSNLYEKSLERDLSYAELQAAYEKNGTPKSVQKVINQMNGLGAVDDKISNEEKLRNRVQLFRDLSVASSSENITASDISNLNARIYENVGNGSLTKEQGQNAINQLIRPSINELTQRLDEYSFDTWRPFDEIGFNDIQDEFNDKFLIQPEDSALSKKQLQIANDQNELRFYEAYNNALQDLMPDGVALADFGKLDNKDKKRILKSAKKRAVEDYAFSATGYIARETDTTQDLINIIQDDADLTRRSQSQDILDNAYQKQPVQNEFTQMSNEELLKFLETE